MRRVTDQIAIRPAWIRPLLPGAAAWCCCRDRIRCPVRRYARFGVMPGSALCLDRIRCRAEKRRAGQRARETGRQAPIGRVAAGIGRNARIRPFTC
jgi:hypothetical protein